MLLFGHIGITLGLFYLLNTKLKKDIDYRFLILGSLLSDIIDKPLGNIVLYNLLNNGRIIGHTLLFAVILAAIGLYRKRIVYLAGGVFSHLALDRMWGDPQTLLWPLLGDFVRRDFRFTDLIDSFYADPLNYIGEAAGIVILISLIVSHRLYLKHRIKDFLATGQLN
ncbi:MAG: metal-dependent hydrolase [Candidatus Aenigmarchaeota archaeon]|nr:metal-dependent hydrolase [Candidatus Aenigmarchaeota archaeon]